MEDRQIIRLLFARAESGISALAAKFGRRLLSTAQNILGNLQDAQESVNDTYLAVWNAIPPREPEPLAGFVYKTGRNLALKKQRDRDTDKRCSRYDVSLEELEGCLSGTSLEDEIDARLPGRAIDRFLDTVPRDSRVLFLRRYWFGDSIKELSAHFAMTENAVSVRLSRIRNQLKLYLIQEGFMYEGQITGRS